MSKKQDREKKEKDRTLKLAKPPVSSLRLDDQLCFPLYATSRQMTRLYGALLEPLGLTYPQYLVLLVLWEKAPRTVTEIGVELQLNTNTLTPLLKRLEQLSLVSRERSKTDERVVQITLTPEGQALRKKGQAIPEGMIAALGWDGNKAARLRELLEDLNLKLTEAISRQENREP